MALGHGSHRHSIMSMLSDAVHPGFVIDDLRPDDTYAINQAATLLVDAFPHWLPTMVEALDEVQQALGTDRICLVARADDQILGLIGAISQYSHAWELHPLVVKDDARK